jgi:hypothetical protein
MNKRFCDKCNEEIKDFKDVNQWSKTQKGDEKMHFELCYNCDYETLVFITTRKSKMEEIQKIIVGGKNG